ncbi:hypothetical protein [Mycolicibacterium sediminis]|uniref:hypothetical protein n=1 Tax=Mycolicibacterium sediminis TaxID=1286180 RepID=UPI0013D04A32|nr:hypothetical protein [Mycolicibacterium sediminis]
MSIITEEPTCKTLNTINQGLSKIQSQGWGAMRATLGPAATWTPDERIQIQAVADAMRRAADQAVPLAKQTPHRVIREIYEQFIAYGRAYADSVSDYQPSDNGLASVNVNASSALVGVCNTIEYGSAGRSLSVPEESSPKQLSPVGDPGNPSRFIQSASAACTNWISRLDTFNASTSDWQSRDGAVPASEWTPERRAIEENAAPLLVQFADASSDAGRSSGNAVLEDLSVMASVYVKAYVSALSSYTDADSWLVYTGFRIANLISGACVSISE